jgi:hypothetical protein
MNFILALRVAGSLYFRPFLKQRRLIGRGGFGPVAQETSIFVEEPAVFIRRAPKEPRLM